MPPLHRLSAFALLPSLLVVALALPSRAAAQSLPPGYVERPPPARPTLTASPGAEAEADADHPLAPLAEDEAPIAFDLALAAEAPLMIGGQATLELPYRFLLQVELGVLPGFAIDAVDGALVGTGAYDAATSDLVRSTLRDSLVARFSGGWRPFPDHGLELLGGYTVASLGGDVSARNAVEAIAGVTVPADIPDADIRIRSTVHALHVGLGWRWVIADHFLVRTSLAYLQAVGSSSHLEVPAALASSPTVQAGASAANQLLDAKLNEVYTTYVKLPLVGVALGYRF